MKKTIYSLLLVLSLPFAQAQTKYDDNPNPGNTGGYAFHFIDQATDATIGDHIIIDLKMDAGKDNLGNMQGGFFRIKIPFAKWVEIEADAVSDRWQITEEVREQYGINNIKGSSDADLTFKTKVKIFSDNPNSARPAVAFQATGKTAMGDFSSTHRFTDSAGYEFAILTSKVVYDSPETIIRKVKLLTELAFVAWDTDQAQQNDAFKGSAGIMLEGKQFNMKVSWLGLYGWQNPDYDKVSMLQIEASKNLKNNRFQVYGQANIGLTPASTPYLVGGGVRMYLNAPKKKKKIVDPFVQ